MGISIIMRAKFIKEEMGFERNSDPKKALKIGAGRYKYPPHDIEFSSGSSDSGTAKISCRIKGLKPRWYGMWYGSGKFSGLLKNEITEFLNSPEIKDLFAQKLNKVFGVNEAQNFERGNDPKKSMGIGITDYKNYVRLKLGEKYPNENLEYLEERFWSNFYEGFSDERPEDVAESMLAVLEHTPLDYQIEWIQGDLEMFDSLMEGDE
jgi:hypothetical protein